MRQELRLLCMGSWILAASFDAEGATQNARATQAYWEQNAHDLTKIRDACAELLRVIDDPQDTHLGSEELREALVGVVSEGQEVLISRNQSLNYAQPRVALFSARRNYTNQMRVQKVLSILKENLAEPPSLEELGRRVGCSPYYLSRIFSQEVGKTIIAALRDLRIEKAAVLLREGRMNVTEVSLEVGYSSLSHFSTIFREQMGCSPKDYPIVLMPGTNEPD